MSHNTLQSVNYENFAIPSEEKQAADLGDWEEEFKKTPDITEAINPDRVEFNETLHTPADTLSEQTTRVEKAQEILQAKDDVNDATKNTAESTDTSSSSPSEQVNDQPKAEQDLKPLNISKQAENMQKTFGLMMQERARVAREANEARSVEAQAPEEPSGRHSEAPDRVSFAETMANAQLENRESTPLTATEVIRNIGTAAATPETVAEAPSVKAIEEADDTPAEPTEKLKIGERLTARADKIPDGMPAIKEAIAEKGGLKGILKKAWMKATFRSDARRANRLASKESRLTKKQDKINEKLISVQYEKAFQAKKAEEREKERQVLVDKARAASAAKQQRKQNRQEFRQENYNNVRQSVSESNIGRITANAARKSKQYIKGEKIQTKPAISPEERAARMADLSQ